jgi:hypothetical protein
MPGSLQVFRHGTGVTETASQNGCRRNDVVQERASGCFFVAPLCSQHVDDEL